MAARAQMEQVKLEEFNLKGMKFTRKKDYLSERKKIHGANSSKYRPKDCIFYTIFPFKSHWMVQKCYTVRSHMQETPHKKLSLFFCLF